ncbi:MAG TPA: Fe-S protein assembly co-chaperone HscB [Candidatus Acidoferrales bacterium]|nr:Fe-S protein assembly co-chaperone HscB [Candidatus Acidoferrales bacterium]
MSSTKTQTGAAPAQAGPCWNCKAAVGGGHFCVACGKIQPLSNATSYFAFFGLPQKLKIDEAELEQRFHQLSWKLHPDNFVRASEFERNLALERSSELNDAYRTLREPVLRVEYLLLCEGVRKEGTTKQQAPPELLEEVFELNESLDELRDAKTGETSDGGDLTALRGKLTDAQGNFQEKLDEVDAELQNVFSEWDSAIDASADGTARRAVSAKLNEVLNRRSYIKNLVRNVAQELEA